MVSQDLVRLSSERLARIFGTEEDPVNCSFFFKIGACRNGEFCNKRHNRPTCGNTLLIHHMYPNTPESLAIAAEDPWDDDTYDRAQQHLEQFYWEVFLELANFGEVEDLVVVDNLAPHIIGNVYVKYYHEKSAERALKGLTGRAYMGRMIDMEYTTVTDFRDARCRAFYETRCDGFKGTPCNFLHFKHIPRAFKRRVIAEMYREHPEYLRQAGGASAGIGRRDRSRSTRRDAGGQGNASTERPEGRRVQTDASIAHGRADEHQQQVDPSYGQAPELRRQSKAQGVPSDRRRFAEQPVAVPSLERRSSRRERELDSERMQCSDEFSAGPSQQQQLQQQQENQDGAVLLAQRRPSEKRLVSDDSPPRYQEGIFARLETRFSAEQASPSGESRQRSWEGRASDFRVGRRRSAQKRSLSGELPPQYRQESDGPSPRRHFTEQSLQHGESQRRGREVGEGGVRLKRRRRRVVEHSVLSGELPQRLQEERDVRFECRRFDERPVLPSESPPQYREESDGRSQKRRSAEQSQQRDFECGGGSARLERRRAIKQRALSGESPQRFEDEGDVHFAYKRHSERQVLPSESAQQYREGSDVRLDRRRAVEQPLVPCESQRRYQEGRGGVVRLERRSGEQSWPSGESLQRCKEGTAVRLSSRRSIEQSSLYEMPERGRRRMDSKPDSVRRRFTEHGSPDASPERRDGSRRRDSNIPGSAKPAVLPLLE